MKPHVLRIDNDKKPLKTMTSILTRKTLLGWDRGGTIKIVWKIPKSELSENRKMFALTLKDLDKDLSIFILNLTENTMF